MACLKIYRQLLSLATFLRVYSNSKEVSYPSWQITYPNLKTTCHIKLNVFLWTILLDNLLLAKYLVSVAAPLKHGKFSMGFWSLIFMVIPAGRSMCEVCLKCKKKIKTTILFLTSNIFDALFWCFHCWL